MVTTALSKPDANRTAQQHKQNSSPNSAGLSPSSSSSSMPMDTTHHLASSLSLVQGQWSTESVQSSLLPPLTAATTAQQANHTALIPVATQQHANFAPESLLSDF